MNFDFASFLRGGGRPAPNSPANPPVEGSNARPTSQTDATALLAPQSLASADALAAAVAAGDNPVTPITVPKGRVLRPNQDVYNIDLRQPGEEQPQLKVSPITMLKTDFRLEMLCQIAVNSTYICYALKAGHIRVLNKNTAGRALLKGHTGLITDMKFFAPSSNLVASSSKAGDILVRVILETEGDIKDQVLLKFPGACPAGFNTKLAWHPSDPNSLAYISGGRLCFLHVPDPESVTAAAELTDPALQLYHLPDEEFTSVAFSPSGECIAVSSQQGMCYAWWLLGPPGAVGEPNMTFKPHAGNPVSTIQFLSSTPASARVLTGNATNSEIKLWQLAVSGKAQCLYTLHFEAAAPQAFHNHLVLQPALNLVILANSQQTQVFAVHYTDSEDTLRFTYISEFSHMHRILSLTSEVDASLEQCDLYCVQTEAIQRYMLDRAACVPTPEDLVVPQDLIMNRQSSSNPATPVRPGISTDMTNTPASGPSLPVLAAVERTSSGVAPGTPVRAASATPSEKTSAVDVVSTPKSVEVSASIPTGFPGGPSESALAAAPALLGPVEPITAAPPAIPSGAQTAYPPLQAFPPSVSSSSSFSSLPSNPAAVSKGSQGPAPPASSLSTPVSPKEAVQASAAEIPAQASPMYAASDVSATPSATSITAQAASIQLLTPSSSSLASPAVTSSHLESAAVSPFPTTTPPFSSSQPQVPPSLQLITPDTFKTMPSVVKESSSSSSVPSSDTAGGALLAALLQRDVSAIGGAAAAAAAPPLPEGASLPLVPSVAATPVQAAMTGSPAPTITATSHIFQPEVVSAPAAATTAPVVTSVPHLVGPLELMQDLASNAPDTTPTAASTPMERSTTLERNTPASSTTAAEPLLPASVPSQTGMDESAMLAMQKAILDTLASHHKEVMKGLGRLSGIGEIQKQLGKLETSVNKTLEQQLNKVTQRKADDERKRNVALEAALEKTLPTLAASISKEVAASMREVNAGLLASITPALEKSVGSALQASLVAELAGPVLQSSLQTAVGAQLKVTLFETLRRNFEVQVIPAFEKATQAMFSQMEAHLKWGLAEHLKLASSASPEVVAALKESTSQVQALTTQLTSMKHELSDLQVQLAGMTSSQGASSSSQSAVGRPMTLSQIEEQHDPKTFITKMLKLEKYEEAFSKALSLSNLDTLMWTVRQLSVKKLADDPCPLSQPVLLSLVQQLAFDLQDDTETKLEWILEAAHNLQPAEKYRGYMNQVLANLNSLLAREPQSDVARKAKLCILLLKNLLV